MGGYTPFLPQPKFLRNLVLSPNAQATWNSDVFADASFTMRERFDGGAVMELTSSRRTDQNYSGKGTSFATDGQVTMWDIKLNGLKTDLHAYLAGWAFAFLTGKDTVTGAASPYTHTFTFDETTRVAVPTNIYMEDTEDIRYKCPDMCVDEVTLTINEMGAISIEITMMGTGRQTIVSMAEVPALTAYSYLLGSDCAFTLNAASLLGRHMNTTFKFSNQLEVHKAPGGGLYGMFVRKGNPKFSFSTSIAAKQADDIYTLLENDTASNCVWNVNSGAAAQLQISVPVAHLKTTKVGFDKDMIVWQIEGDETTCYDVAGAAPVSVQVINAQASYLTAV